MNEMELQTTLDPIEMDMGDPVIEYSPVYPNPVGDPTDDLTKVQIQGDIYKVKDPEVHDWARTEEKPTYTKEEVGLGNVDNTSDMDKPVSTATQTALDNKVDKVAGKGLSEEDFTHTLKTKLDGIENGAEVNVQSDFAQSDSSADDFIKNKPTKLSDFDNDEGFIDNSVNNLENYYKKSETYTKSEVNSALNGKADKSDTYTKLEVDSALDNKVDKVEGKGLSENDFTDTLKDKLDGIEAEANKTVVDNSVTATSTNPVESKAIYNLLNDLLPEATETGNPISITNASGLNAKSLKVELEPIQDLNGYDSAWVGGGGKNKLPPKDSTTVANNITYTPNADESITITAQSITGTATMVYGGIYGVNSVNPDLCKPLPNGLTAGGSLFMKIEGNPEGMELLCQFQKSDGSIIENRSTASTLSATISPNASFVYICLRINKNTVSLPINATVKCYVGSEQVTAWQPYSNICPISGRTQTEIEVNGETTTISFGQTVYGGEVDVTSGGTSDEFVLHELDGTETNWQYYSVAQGNLFRIAFDDRDNTVEFYTLSPYCNSYKVSTQGARVNGTVSGGLNTREIDFIDNRFSDLTQWKQNLSSNHIQIAYKKATPTTINTPAFYIPLNKGNNTLTADGDMELIYSKIPQ